MVIFHQAYRPLALNMQAWKEMGKEEEKPRLSALHPDGPAESLFPRAFPCLAVCHGKKGCKRDLSQH